jgi:DVNP family
MTGSRRMVYAGTAHHTPGGLTASDLVMTKYGRIASKKKIQAYHKNPYLVAWAKSFKEVRNSYIREGKSTSGFTPLRKGTPEYKAIAKVYMYKYMH